MIFLCFILIVLFCSFKLLKAIRAAQKASLGLESVIWQIPFAQNTKPYFIPRLNALNKFAVQKHEIILYSAIIHLGAFTSIKQFFILLFKKDKIAIYPYLTDLRRVAMLAIQKQALSMNVKPKYLANFTTSCNVLSKNKVYISAHATAINLFDDSIGQYDIPYDITIHPIQKPYKGYNYYAHTIGIITATVVISLSINTKLNSLSNGFDQELMTTFWNNASYDYYQSSINPIINKPVFGEVDKIYKEALSSLGLNSLNKQIIIVNDTSNIIFVIPEYKLIISSGLLSNITSTNGLFYLMIRAILAQGLYFQDNFTFFLSDIYLINQLPSFIAKYLMMLYNIEPRHDLLRLDDEKQAVDITAKKYKTVDGLKSSIELLKSDAPIIKYITTQPSQIAAIPANWGPIITIAPIASSEEQITAQSQNELLASYQRQAAEIFTRYMQISYLVANTLVFDNSPIELQLSSKWESLTENHNLLSNCLKDLESLNQATLNAAKKEPIEISFQVETLIKKNKVLIDMVQKEYEKITYQQAALQFLQKRTEMFAVVDGEIVFNNAIAGSNYNALSKK